MPAEWTKLPEGQREECASVSCGHSAASWRMDSGGHGSYFCETCHGKMTGIGNMKDLMAPILDAKDNRIAELEAIMRRVETWWIEDGMHKYDGAPECIFALRAALNPANTAEEPGPGSPQR